MDEDAAEVDEEEEMTEIRFIPEDSANIQQFYDIISDCNLLHDPPQSNSSGRCSGRYYLPALQMSIIRFVSCESECKNLAIFLCR